MKCCLTFLLTVLSFVSVRSQQETFSYVPHLLQKYAAAKTDTARILLECRLAEAYRSHKPDTSFILADKALNKSIELNFKKGEIHSWIVLCVLHREKGDLPYALEVGLKALKLSEEEGLAYERIYSLIRIALVYAAVKDSPKTITYLKKAEECLKADYDDFQWSITQYFLGDAYEQLNDLDAAEKQVQMLDRKHGSSGSWDVINNRLKANIAVKRNKLPDAIGYYRTSYLAAIKDSTFRDASTASNAMAAVFIKLNQRDSAIYYAKQGLKLGEMLSYRSRILIASSLLAELYAEKDPKEAVKYYQIASAAKDSLYGVRKVQQLQSATMLEQERQTEMEAARLASTNRMRQWALLGGVGAFLAIALILYRNNRQKQNTNKILEGTLANLKAAQSQLIHQEKMASLGELTAGVAHEIQNPLNFVNNFSEVNNELIEEVKSNAASLHGGQKSKLKSEELEELLNDIYQNNEKISHHGKRADAIVKGMLQHSRSSSGQKEATDINALCDEYLRLGYHGLRAKDKTFNAKCETHFDKNVGTVNVIPQDIGRVILNLINNAFYSVNERRNSATNGYEPTVLVSTSKVNDQVEITVKDNGTGIPQKVLDKIFQPFFTTKPTGQGTGLGLSLSYDIVMAHGGKLIVETKEGEGSEFIIRLFDSHA